MSDVTATNHLSIGEVLSLVQEDFPDVTISKIRFLESQGLIAPERTGSGYRKFYGADIERLRWILRQQRDHFLPLKVIKKMLDDGVDMSGTIETQPTLWASTDEEGGSDTSSAPGDPADRTTDAAAGEARGGSSVAPGGEAEDAEDAERAAYRSPSHPAVASAAPRSGSSRRSATAAGSRSASVATSDRSTATAVAGPDATPATSAGSSKSASATTPPTPNAGGGSAATGGRDARTNGDAARSAGSASGTNTGTGADTGGAPGGPETERPAHSTPADVVAALQEDPRSARKRRQKGAGRAANTAAEAVGGDPAASTDTVSTEPAPSAPGATRSSAGASTLGSAPSVPADPSQDTLLSAEELCELCGIDADLLADLEQFGLIVAASLGGRSAYDAEAIDVARMASKYAELGVEPRHLRMYKISAEREAGFVEQLVVPLIKQRNPAARQLAVDRCDELMAMGAELHAALLRRQLSRIIGG